MIKNVFASIAAAGLVLTPLAAQAGTQAAESTVSLAPIASDVSRVASPVTGSEEFLTQEDLLWLLPLLLALGLTLHEVVSSPGIFD